MKVRRGRRRLGNRELRVEGGRWIWDKVKKSWEEVEGEKER